MTRMTRRMALAVTLFMLAVSGWMAAWTVKAAPPTTDTKETQQISMNTAAEGVRFITRSRVFSGAEIDALDAAGPPPVGPDAMGL